MSTMWAIWLHRNEMVFRGGTSDIQRTTDAVNEWIKRQEEATRIQDREREYGKSGNMQQKP